MAFLSVPAVFQRPKSSFAAPATSKCAPNYASRRRAISRMSLAGSDGTTVGAKDVDVEDDGLVVNVIGADYDLMVQEKGKKKVRPRTRKLLDEIDGPEVPDKLTSDAGDLPAISNDETMPWVRTAIRAGDERKALNPLAIRVAQISYITSFVVVLTGRSEPQTRAIANLVEQSMHKEHALAPKRKSGGAGWILLDYGDMLVNVFLPEQRTFYNLEKLWKDGEDVDISDCLSKGVREFDDDDDSDEFAEKSKDDSLDDWIS